MFFRIRKLRVPNLFSKDEDLLKSAPYIGYEILKLFEGSEEPKISIFQVARKLKKKYNANIRTIYYGMIFLHSLEIIDFESPFLVKK